MVSRGYETQDIQVEKGKVSYVCLDAIRKYVSVSFLLLFVFFLLFEEMSERSRRSIHGPILSELLLQHSVPRIMTLLTVCPNTYGSMIA